MPRHMSDSYIWDTFQAVSLSDRHCFSIDAIPPGHFHKICPLIAHQISSVIVIVIIIIASIIIVAHMFLRATGNFYELCIKGIRKEIVNINIKKNVTTRIDEK